MIAAAVAQVVAGSNNVQTQGSIVPVNLTNNETCQTHFSTNNPIERTCSAIDVHKSGCDNKGININDASENPSPDDISGFRSGSGSTLQVQQSNFGSKDPFEGSGPVDTARFISDGISQLTMGSFQVIFVPMTKNKYVENVKFWV